MSKYISIACSGVLALVTAGFAKPSKRLLKALAPFLLLVPLAWVSSAQADPAEGFCNGLDPSSGLFSTCIQAHSAFNRVDHLIDVGANEKAVARAQLSLDEAIAAYAELTNGELVPGLPSAEPILAVAYINRDGIDGFGTGDVLIAKLIDTDSDGQPSIGDTVITNKYPTDLSASGEGEFNVKEHGGFTTFISLDGGQRLLFRSATAQFLFQSREKSSNCWYESYSEGTSAGILDTTIFDADGSGCVLGSTASDFVRVNPLSPSNPTDTLNVAGGFDPGDAIYIDVDIFDLSP